MKGIGKLVPNNGQRFFFRVTEGFPVFVQTKQRGGGSFGALVIIAITTQCRYDCLKPVSRVAGCGNFKGQLAAPAIRLSVVGIKFPTS